MRISPGIKSSLVRMWVQLQMWVCSSDATSAELLSAPYFSLKLSSILRCFMSFSRVCNHAVVVMRKVSVYFAVSPKHLMWCVRQYSKIIRRLSFKRGNSVKSIA